MKSAFAPLLLALALLAGCATPPNPSPAAGAAKPGVSDRIGSPQFCSAENQPCGAANACCGGFVCLPNGRLGSLCRTPFPG